MNNRIDLVRTKVTYRLNLPNIFVQGTSMNIHRWHTEVSLGKILLMKLLEHKKAN